MIINDAFVNNAYLDSIRLYHCPTPIFALSSGSPPIRPCKTSILSSTDRYPFSLSFSALKLHGRYLGKNGYENLHISASAGLHAAAASAKINLSMSLRCPAELVRSSSLSLPLLHRRNEPVKNRNEESDDSPEEEIASTSRPRLLHSLIGLYAIHDPT